MTNKIDFKKELDAYRARQGQFSVVDVPELRYLMIDGHGDPNTASAFTDAAEALYPLAYRLKFASKLNLGRWKACGGPTTWTRSRRHATSPGGTGL